jgi:hypothetical protein
MKEENLRLDYDTGLNTIHLWESEKDMYKNTLRKRTSIEKYKMKINDCGEK